MLNKSKIKSNPRWGKRKLLIVHPRGGRWGSKWIRHKAGSAQPASAVSTAPGPVVPAHFRVTAGPLTESISGSWPVVGR